MSTATIFFYEQNGKEFFHLTRTSIADINAIPFVFDGPATERQKKEYAKEYAYFLERKSAINLPIESAIEIDKRIIPEP